MTRYILVFLSFLLYFPHGLFSQNASDLYLFSLEKSSQNEYHVFNARFLSNFNRGGYNNQPYFTTNNDLLISARREGESQNDIYQLSIATRKFKRLTQTVDYEYSPMIHPDEEHLSVLRKKQGNELHQQVCIIPLRSGEMECVTHNLKDVGYYAWLGTKALGLYRIEGNSSHLSYYDLETGRARRVTNSIGRTLHAEKGGTLVYIHKYSNDTWHIRRYKPVTSEMETVVKTVALNEDFALSSDGTYFMADGHLLYYYHPDKDKSWKLAGDLSAYGIKYISRLAVSPDSKKIAVVASAEK